jgi:hypothetical protein
MNPLNLLSKKQELHDVAKEIFDYLVGLPQDVRFDEKPRTGIQVLLRNPDYQSEELITFPVYKPSDRAQYFVMEKSLRTELFGDATSQNTEKETEKKFRGCITVSLEDCMFHCSVSGLYGSEDVAIAIILSARATESSIDDVIYNIMRRDGKLPKEFSQPGHYLFELLAKYK